MALYVVATPIGNLDDITKRSLDILNKVDLIACEDTRTSSKLLKHFNINTKTVSYHKFNEKEKSNIIINDLLNGKDIALISDAGCPCISDPGSILVNAAIKNNIIVYGIPGASAVTTAIMCSGMDSSSFSFYGFLSRENKKMEEELLKIQNDSSNIAISDTFGSGTYADINEDNAWIAGKTVLTTTEWNELADKPVRFKVNIQTTNK